MGYCIQAHDPRHAALKSIEDDMISLNGFLNLNKPVGPSSAMLLNRVKRHLPRGTKIGHAGTLDPLAEGVLVALIGRCTRKSDAVMASPKQYRAVVRLGATSDTDDSEGPLHPTTMTDVPDVERVRTTIARFVGAIQQTPPAYSAIKLGGKRACDRVRSGDAVVMQPRTVLVKKIDIISFIDGDLTLLVDCGKGTYIRSLARDIGAALGVGGYLAALCRTRVGRFDVASGTRLEQIESDGVAAHLLPEHFMEGAADAL
jgi:tRNA pseudouridine55 synthase